MNMMLREAHNIIHSVFIYAAFTEEGYVKVGISRIPRDRVLEVHHNSPFPIVAAMWAWVGSKDLAEGMERDLKAVWKERNTRGEWYKFDYQEDKRSFHDVINLVFKSRTKRDAEWQKQTPADMRNYRNEAQGKRTHDAA